MIVKSMTKTSKVFSVQNMLDNVSNNLQNWPNFNIYTILKSSRGNVKFLPNWKHLRDIKFLPSFLVKFNLSSFNTEIIKPGTY